MPHPLASLGREVGYHLGNSWDSPSRHRPELSLMAMSVVAEWSLLENFVNTLFVSMLGSDAPGGAAIFATIRNQAGQRDAINAVAETHIANRDLRDAILAALDVYKGASKTRNRLVHWIWGHSPELPDAVLLANPVTRTALSANRQRAVHDRNVDEIMRGDADLAGIFIYERQDFEAASQSIQRAITLVALARMTVSRLHAPYMMFDQELSQLLAEPEIQRGVDRLRRDRQIDP